MNKIISKYFKLFTLFIFFMVFPEFFVSALTLEKQKICPCGLWPKQVLFSPDNKTIVIPLLNDIGFNVINTKDGQAKKIKPPRAKNLGFAEGLFINSKNRFLVSQMTTGYLYEYDYPSFTFEREISSGGLYPKFMTWSEDKQIIAVSNWVSNNVSIIDYKSGKIIREIKTAAAPRGLAFTEKGNCLIVTCFDGGEIQKFSTNTGKLIDNIVVKNSSMRHIVLNKDETKAYVSDMYHALIYTIDIKNFIITNKYKVFNNPNTIALYKDRWLFVSSRGPNNPKDYTQRSPVNGKITVIDTTNGKVTQTIGGGNQPTGLDISPDGKLLCFSNFQDANVELYNIKL